jgi:3-hydroxybutyrate dehydrogenase
MQKSLPIQRALALEVARSKVTVNAICPGFLDTDMTEHSIRTITEKTGCTPLEARSILERFNPQNRLFEPSEVTSAALWLCSPGSDGINGQAITISGGEV